MGTLSLEKIDHLLWLGRYIERSYTTQRFITTTYDKAIDSTEGNWKGQLEELGFAAETDDVLEFFRDCLFNESNLCSLAHSMGAAYDNAVMLRDVLGTESLSYVQMATDEIKAAESSDSPLLDLQLVQDNIMAFKGCVDDYVTDDAARNIIKCGISIERIDLYARLSYRLDCLKQEVHRLASRIDRTGAPYDKQAFKELIDIVFSSGFPENATYETLGKLLSVVARIFA
ncbi:alpha-E domain-containing protein [uncultured Ellagibacter sp.]|uniref:alpha-E domain-containing protein n=1 Tax=uncultured Ellagibacter sp. TaxID=2137580 RepID=UPI00260B503F|nr:alpha-E domain-containing protein [uncultured Ellagibacter sp.]